MGKYEYKFRYSYDSRWWLSYFGEELFFPFINHANKLDEFIKSQSSFLDYVKLFGKRVRINSIINEFIGFDLLKAKTKKGLIEEVIEIFEKQNAQLTLNEWFAKTSVKMAKKGFVFDTITHFYDSDNSLYNGNSRIEQSRLIDENLVILGGSICSIQSLQHNSRLYDSLKGSDYKWVLCDFPPEGMTIQNEDYKPNLVYLKFDNEFEKIFNEIVPFSEKIGWHPRCTVTGFFNHRTAAIKNFPELKVCLTSSYKPKHPDEIVVELKSFLAKEIKNPIHLDDLSDRVIIYYLVLEAFHGWGISLSNIDLDLKQLLSQMITEDIDQLSLTLQTVYREEIFK